jgi:glycosyltransferase involved in cell wall biosynthesis
MTQSKGGTEILYENLLNRLGEDELKGINLIVNRLSPELIQSNQVNVLWNHHSYDQPAISAYASKELVNKVQYFIYVSNWQYEKYRYQFGIPESRSLVIKNAINSIELKEKPKKIRLIYTSTPWRGLDVLLEAFSILNRNDVELDVYSSTVIYGSKFYEENEKNFKTLFQRAASMKNVNYHGYANNADIRDALMSSHIFAYPCTFEETSCLSAIEAGMAGLSIVTTNLGALYETVNAWGWLLPYDSNKVNLAKKFAGALNIAIDDYWTKETQQRLQEQHIYYKKFYTWDSRINEWRNFLAHIKRKALLN